MGEQKSVSRRGLLAARRKADEFRSTDPQPDKSGGGERGDNVSTKLRAKFRPGMPVGERTA